MKFSRFLTLRLEHGPAKIAKLTVCITIAQSDIGKYHESVAPYYYECAARVIIL